MNLSLNLSFPSVMVLVVDCVKILDALQENFEVYLESTDWHRKFKVLKNGWVEYAELADDLMFSIQDCVDGGGVAREESWII